MKLDRTKLLGFRIADTAGTVKVGVKVGTKFGVKVGVKA